MQDKVMMTYHHSSVDRIRVVRAGSAIWMCDPRAGAGDPLVPSIAERHQQDWFVSVRTTVTS